MDKIKDVLHSVFRDLEKKQQGVDFEKASLAWEKAVGPKAAAHTKIVYLTKEKIRVNVNNSAWLFELNLKKGQIQKTIKKSLNIDDVRFRLGDI
jgi:predicted nucleic acid-binding Zn ribbon protein